LWLLNLGKWLFCSTNIIWIVSIHHMQYNDFQNQGKTTWKKFKSYPTFRGWKVSYKFIYYGVQTNYGEQFQIPSRGGLAWRHLSPPLIFIYNLKTKVILMGKIVIQMHTNGVLKVAYEKPSILLIRWAGGTYVNTGTIHIYTIDLVIIFSSL